MRFMRTIFLPTDFSSKSENAMKYAVDMYQDEPMHYVLIHSYDIPYQPNEVIISSILETLKEDIEHNLKQQESRLRSMFHREGNLITWRMGVGSVVDMIKYNEDMEPDFVVMGTRGRSQKPGGFLIGNNTLQVLKSVDVPILVIPDGCTYSPLKHIVFGSDLKALSEEVIRPLNRVLDRTRASLTVVHVGEISEESRERSLQELNQLMGDRMTSFVQINSSEIVEGLRKTALDTHSDLLVLVDRRRNFFQRIFHRSVTQEIGWKTEIPMLVLHE